MGGGVTSNQPLKSVLKPNESRGYILWSKVPSAKYVVNMYTKNSNGDLICVGVKSTDKNYLKLDKTVYNNEQGYFSVSAFNNGNGSLITTGPVEEYIGNQPPTDLVCDRKCNGSTYAWKLEIREGAPGNTQMSLNSTLDYYNYDEDFAVPFYFAMSEQAYDALPPNHPYKVITGYYTSNGVTKPVYQYKQIYFEDNSPGGPYQGPSGLIGGPGYLIEKKANQFDYMMGSVATGNPSLNNCDPGLTVQSGGSWMWYYNAYVDQTSWSQIPTSVEPFAPVVPTQLECDVISNPGSDTGDDTDAVELFNYYLTPCLDDPNTVTVQDYVSCTENSNSEDDANSNPIVGYEVKYLTQNKKSIIGYIGDPTPRKITQLKDGLYEIIFYTKTKAVPIVFEQNSEIITKEDRELVKLTITPTIVENGLLKFKINSEKNMNVNIKVNSLDGTTFHDENTSLSCSFEKTREVLINANNLPQNQLRITLTFDDGSVLQETALKMN